MNSLHFEALKEEDLLLLLEKISTTLSSFSLEEEAKLLLCRMASGDARKLVSFLDVISLHPKKETSFQVEEIRQLVDAPGGMASSGEGRYLMISALHKAVRGSDCNAALYWFARLLEAGEDPRYLARRLIRMASEDIGLADPTALSLALHGAQSYQMLGSPEGDLALAEVVVYLALSPKSASCYVAFGKAKESARLTRHLSPPSHIINAPTKWMEKQGFGQGYIWEHDIHDCISHQSFWPNEMESQSFYLPVQRGFERQMEERFNYFERLREKKRKEHESS
jgi:putative ATPase